MTRTLRTRSVLAILTALSFLAVACGDDDDDPAISGSATTVSTLAVNAEYCEKTLEIETVEEPDIDFESLSEDEQKAAARQFTIGELQPLARQIQAAAPTAIRADVDTLVAAVDQVAETGDFAAFETPATEAASDRLHTYDVANCGWAAQAVSASDYRFDGVAATLQPGPTSFDLNNGGAEMHELAVVKKKSGVTESFDEILALGEEEGQEKVDFVGGIDPVAPGDGDYLVLDLERGEYLVVCFLPVGSTPAAFEAADSGGEPPAGPPHFQQGMKVAVTVA